MQSVYMTMLNLLCLHGPDRWADVRDLLDDMSRHGIALVRRRIYLHIERERERDLYIYIYVYLYIYMYT